MDKRERRDAKIDFELEAERLKTRIRAGECEPNEPICIAMAAVGATSCWAARVNCGA